MSTSKKKAKARRVSRSPIDSVLPFCCEAFDHMDVIGLLADERGRIRYANKAARRALKYSLKNITGISGSAKSCSEGVTQTAQSMQELNREVQALRQLVGQFVLDK